MAKLWMAVALASGAMIQPNPAFAAARLPIAEGVWVKTATACAAATNVYVYKGNRFGSVYFYGPNQTMGPANETELIRAVIPGKNGYTTINEGPIEVAPRSKEQASVRAYSLSQGPQWTETIRICPTASLSLKLRTSLAGLSLL